VAEAKNKEQYKRAWKGHISELVSVQLNLSKPFNREVDYTDAEAEELAAIIKRLNELVDIAADRLNFDK
jgi:uncharacterized FlaG/YvyC family protein